MAAAPAWIAENVDVGGPEGKSFIDIAVVVAGILRYIWRLPSVAIVSPIFSIMSSSNMAARPIAWGNTVAVPARLPRGVLHSTSCRQGHLGALRGLHRILTGRPARRVSSCLRVLSHASVLLFCSWLISNLLNELFFGLSVIFCIHLGSYGKIF